MSKIFHNEFDDPSANEIEATNSQVAKEIEAKDAEIARLKTEIETWKNVVEVKVIAGPDELRAEIARLKHCLSVANSNHEKFERLWYLEADKTENLSAENARLKQELTEWREICRAITTERDTIKARLSKAEKAVKWVMHSGKRVAQQLAELGFPCSAGGITQLLAELKEGNRRHDGWVSVEDRLPEDMQRVIACYVGVYEYRIVTFWLDGGKNPHFGGLNELDGEGSQPATHWRELPEPPTK